MEGDKNQNPMKNKKAGLIVIGIVIGSILMGAIISTALVTILENL